MDTNDRAAEALKFLLLRDKRRAAEELDYLSADDLLRVGRAAVKMANIALEESAFKHRLAKESAELADS